MAMMKPESEVKYAWWEGGSPFLAREINIESDRSDGSIARKKTKSDCGLNYEVGKQIFRIC